MSSTEKRPSLWTRDFSIISLGSVVSMFGNAMSGFAMSLMVLDISESIFLYSVYLAMYTLPQFILPDLFSRKKAICMPDFFSAFLYIFMAILLRGNWFSFPVFALFCFILGSVQSTCMVACESFYPLLITEGNYQKAYSIASVLETLSAVMVPVSTLLYNRIGLSPLLMVNGISFFPAAAPDAFGYPGRLSLSCPGKGAAGHRRLLCLFLHMRRRIFRDHSSQLQKGLRER